MAAKCANKRILSVDWEDIVHKQWPQLEKGNVKLQKGEVLQVEVVLSDGMQAFPYSINSWIKGTGLIGPMEKKIIGKPKKKGGPEPDGIAQLMFICVAADANATVCVDVCWESHESALISTDQPLRNETAVQFNVDVICQDTPAPDHPEQIFYWHGSQWDEKKTKPTKMK